MIPILVLHGPNLNLLGVRQPEIYGSMTLNELNQLLIRTGEDLGLEIRAVQSNNEGALVDALQESRSWARAVIFNPGGYTHTSVALYDAVAALEIPVVEVHLSNIWAREEFRRRSYIAPVALGSIAGFGWRSYWLAIHALAELFKENSSASER